MLISLCFIFSSQLLLFFPYMVDQAEKDAKRKARAKELKKLRRAKEKKTQVNINIPPSINSEITPPPPTTHTRKKKEKAKDI